MSAALAKSRYRRLTELFQHCIHLPPRKRHEYVSHLGLEDAELEPELRALLRQHTGKFETAAPRPAAPSRPAPSRPGAWKAALWIALVAAAFALLLPIRTSLWVAPIFLLGAGPIFFFLVRRRARGREVPGDSVGSYVLERRLGSGATSDIYLAKHALLKRPTAIKILNDLRPGPEAARRFEREARLASRLGHPNTIQVFDYGKTPDGRLFVAMEYVMGLNLSQLVTLEPNLPVSRVVFMLRQIAGSLEEAHMLGLVHRDLKPLNIMLTSKSGTEDTIKVLDFGIASQLSGPEEDVIRSESIVGTPGFMAPERFWAPLQLDPRSDIYSFGAVAFHLLTGRSVFECGGPEELIYQVLTAERPSPSRLRGERIPDELENLVLDCLAVSPALRPATFRTVRDRLRRVPLIKRWSRDDAHEWWSDNRESVGRFLQATV